MTDTKLTAPAPGDEITLKLTVLDGTVQMGGKHYGDTVRVVVRVDSGDVDGVHFGNLFLTADAKSRWFPRQAGEALKAIDEGRDPAEPKAKPQPKSKKAADDKPADVSNLDPRDDEDLGGFTMKQLHALADRKGIAYPRGAKKAELVALVRDGLQTEAA